MSKRSDFREKEKKYMPHIVVSSPLPQDDEKKKRAPSSLKKPAGKKIDSR
jgi:hypothetical protein